MLKRSIITVSELFEALPTTGDATHVVICDDYHRQLTEGFWFADSIVKYADYVVEEFTYSAKYDTLKVYLLEYSEPDNTAAY